MNLICSVSGLAFFQGTTFLPIAIFLVFQESVTHVPGLSVTSLPGLYPPGPSPILGEGWPSCKRGWGEGFIFSF